MDREISIFVEIGVGLIAVSIFIGVLWVTVGIGSTMASDASMVGASVVSSIGSASSLESLMLEEDAIPAAAVYTLIQSNYSTIGTVTCNMHSVPIENDVSTGSLCIMSHMSGKVKVEVELAYSGWYNLTIHNQKCDFKTVCTCSLYT